MSRYITVNADIDVDLGDFETDDLIEELENRGHRQAEPTTSIEGSLIDKIFHLRRQGKDYQKELDEYLYIVTGRAI